MVSGELRCRYLGMCRTPCTLRERSVEHNPRDALTRNEPNERRCFGHGWHSQLEYITRAKRRGEDITDTLTDVGAISKSYRVGPSQCNYGAQIRGKGRVLTAIV